jgi:PIN domain nuclease of toxin-antitoxin system
MENKITKYAIDACAFIAYLREEEGCDKLKLLFKDKDNDLFIHSVNLAEIYYDTLRVSGKQKADERFDDVKSLPIKVVWTLDVSLIELVGKYKTSYKISFADSFFLALTEKEDAIAISTDHHEFDEIEQGNKLPFYWLR